MGQTDLAIRFLADHFAPDLLPTLLGTHEVQILGVEPTEVKLIERQTDKVAHALVDGVECMIHFEFQADHKKIVPYRTGAYNALLRHRYHPLEVLSVVVYLMHEAPSEPVPTGIHGWHLDFDYEVFCPWEHCITVEHVCRQPALAPIAVLTRGVEKQDLPQIRQAIEQATLPAGRRGDLLTIAFIIAGRRFPANLLNSYLWSDIMEQSSTYRWIKAEGRAEGEVIGEAKGEAAALRQVILELVDARLGRKPEGLENHLQELNMDSLRDLFSRLVRAPHDADLEALLPT